MKYILSVSRGVLLLLHTAVHMLGLAIHSIWFKGDSDELGFRYRRLWAKRALKLLGIKIDELNVRTEAKNVLYVSNHRTLTDPIVQAAIFDGYIIAKNEVGSIPIIGKGAAMTGVILVDRDRLNSRLAARNKTKELLANGKSVLVYAEGTTTTERITGSFKIGTFKAAAELGVSVMPIAIDYRDPKDYWSESSLVVQMINQIGALRSCVKMSMGAVISHDNPKELMSQTKLWIDDELIRLQENWSKVF